MHLSACLIVKNEAEMLGKTLPELSCYIDEIILVDTGSTDNTVEVAEKYGAKVYRFPWINDFSAARNESLKYATGDWIVWIDADEYLTTDNLLLLKTALVNCRENAASVTIYESKLDTCEKHNGYSRVKVFKNKLGYHFVRPINEQLVDKAGQVVLGQEIPVCVYHWGRYLAEAKLLAKKQRYVAHYSAALEKLPDDHYLHFLLANTYNDLGELDLALEHYNAVVRVAGQKEIGRQALEKKADLLLRQKKLKEAVDAANELIKIEPENMQAYITYASIMLITGQIDPAIKVLKEALSIKIARKVENVYQTQAMPNFLLSKAYGIKGEKELAQACLSKALAIAPDIMRGSN